MALRLLRKAATETVSYSWFPDLTEGDSVVSYTLTETGCTITSEENLGNEIAFYVSGGTSGTTATIVGLATTHNGEVLEETFYLPIFGTASVTTPTASDVCAFALRKIVGMGESPDADELADALERLNDMLHTWRSVGAITGVTFPMLAATELLIRDEFVSAIKHNLRLVCHEHYGEPITAYDAQMARAGLALIKNANLPEERARADYY